MFALVKYDQGVDESSWRRYGRLSQLNLAACSVEGRQFHLPDGRSLVETTTKGNARAGKTMVQCVEVG